LALNFSIRTSVDNNAIKKATISIIVAFPLTAQDVYFSKEITAAQEYKTNAEAFLIRRFLFSRFSPVVVFA
jgi:adenosylcobinamide amidohydrolase